MDASGNGRAAVEHDRVLQAHIRRVDRHRGRGCGRPTSSTACWCLTSGGSIGGPARSCSACTSAGHGCPWSTTWSSVLATTILFRSPQNGGWPVDGQVRKLRRSPRPPRTTVSSSSCRNGEGPGPLCATADAHAPRVRRRSVRGRPTMVPATPSWPVTSSNSSWTARPEIGSRRRGWGNGSVRSSRPLGDREGFPAGTSEKSSTSSNPSSADPRPRPAP